MADVNGDKDKTSQELADARTEWAEDRTVLANERTFAAWMRTGMACIALALGLKAVFGSTDYPLAARAVAELFIGCAVLIFFTASRRSRRTHRRINNHDAVAQSQRNMLVTSTAMTVGALGTGVILWFL